MTEKTDQRADLAAVQARIGYSFKDQELLLQALTHRSFSAESTARSAPDNERLEFVGDAVLGLAAARHLAEAHPAAREGELSRLRAALVGERGLAAAARALALGGHLRLGRGEERSGGREKPSILAGALEALAGALFLDGGWRCAYRFARSLFQGLKEEHLADPKTRLQETCQERFRETPVYEIRSQTGPAHRPRFVAAVILGGRPLAEGEGGNRKEAEQEAAAAALAEIAP
jgi:ribonuclease-3